MVTEQFIVKVKPGLESQFEAAMEHGLRTVLSRAKGCRTWRLRRGVESANQYQVQIEWDSIEDHLDGYRGSSLALEFRAIVTDYFAEWPTMQHFTELADG